MPARPIFSEPQRIYIREAYLRNGLTTSAITPMLNKKFGTAFTERQVQRLINDRWSKRRTALLQRAEVRIEQAAERRAEKGLVNKMLDNFAERSAKGTSKALDMIERASTPRDLASAASAAKSLLAMTRSCLGIDGTDTRGPRVANFNFNFAAAPIAPAGSAAPAPAVVDVQTSDAHRDDDDDGDAADRDDDELEGETSDVPPLDRSTATQSQEPNTN